VADRFLIVFCFVVAITLVCLVGFVLLPLLAPTPPSALIERTCAALQQGFSLGVGAILGLLGSKALLVDQRPGRKA
jgi:hypothetical protein